jgi:hypothetical protein
MFGRFRQLLPATAWVLGIASVWADAAHVRQTGYLPQAGPLQLRFRALPPPVSEENAQPAAPSPDPRILLPSPPMPATPTNSAVIQPVTNGPAVEFNAREPIPAAPTNAPEPVISPQMLIKYFMGSTNAVSNTNASAPGANGPVGFTSPLGTTPAPPPPISSKPTFSIEP